MPKKYEAIRDSLASQGKPYDEAQASAAAIYNSQRKPGEAPVTGHKGLQALVNRSSSTKGKRK
jgi:hypothetical protein